MVIIAEEQTGGVGRMGRVWVSPTGGIWITIILKPKIPVDHVFMVTMAGAVAVARAIRKEFDLGALIKWPNDIYIGDKKVAGLLLELSAEADNIHYCLLGIGVDANISPGELTSSVTGQCDLNQCGSRARHRPGISSCAYFLRSSRVVTILSRVRNMTRLSGNGKACPARLTSACGSAR